MVILWKISGENGSKLNILLKQKSSKSSNSVVNLPPRSIAGVTSTNRLKSADTSISPFESYRVLYAADEQIQPSKCDEE